MNALKVFWSKFGVALGEPSTWRGMIMILTSLGLGLTHDQQEAIVIAGLAMSGLIGVFFKDAVAPSDSDEHTDLTQGTDIRDIINRGRS